MHNVKYRIYRVRVRNFKDRVLNTLKDIFDDVLNERVLLSYILYVSMTVTLEFATECCKLGS